MRNVDTKVDGADTMPAGNYNAQRDELENAVLSTDQTLDPDAGPDTDLNMLGKALAAYANAGNVYQDSGVADAYVLAIASNLKSVTKYYDNMMIVFKAGTTNTGASTINVNTLGVKSVTLPDGTALVAGDIEIGVYVIAVYSLSNDRFELATVQAIVQHDHSDVANGGVAVADSVTDQGGFPNIVYETIPIGAWDLLTATGSSSISVLLGFIGGKEIRSVLVHVIADTGNIYFAPHSNLVAAGTGGTEVDLDFNLTQSTIDIYRRTGGFFDSTVFDTTSFLIDNAAAVDKGGGLVGIPSTGHLLQIGSFTTISGTTNYDGNYIVVSRTANEIVIEATYVAEVFAGTETLLFNRGWVTLGFIE